MTTNASSDKDGKPNARSKQPADLVLCYLACPTDGANGFLGAILLTDCRVRPQHFSFVQPIKPTVLQRLLYGSTLDEFIKVDVIAQKLWQGLPKKPDVLFVESPELIAVRRISRIPTAFIAKNPESDQHNLSLSTIRYDVGGQSDDQHTVGDIIAALEGACNLLEPFTRIRSALKEALSTKS